MIEPEEKCDLCGRITSFSEDGAIFRLIKAESGYKDSWEELCTICVTCFTDIFLAGVRLRGGIKFKDKIPSDDDLL